MGNATSIATKIHFDVGEEIGRHMEFESLKSISSTNSYLSELANGWIWRYVAIQALAVDDTAKRFEQRCQKLIDDPRRARHVRVLNIRIFSKKRMGREAELLCRVMQAMTNLLSLHIITAPLHFNLASTISSYHYTFKLRRLRTNLPIKRGLVEFLITQPDIEVFDNLDDNYYNVTGLPITILPRLRATEGVPASVTALLAGPRRSINRVTITQPISTRDTPGLVRALAASLTLIEYLSIRYPPPLTSAQANEIGSHSKRLQATVDLRSFLVKLGEKALGITRLAVLGFHVTPDDRGHLGAALPYFHDLREIIFEYHERIHGPKRKNAWNTPSFRLYAFDECAEFCSMTCTEMKIVIHYEALQGGRIVPSASYVAQFDRRADGTWRDQPYKTTVRDFQGNESRTSRWLSS